MKQEIVEMIESALLKFGEAHDLLAKSSLSSSEYKPISALLAEAKIELFDARQLIKKNAMIVKVVNK